MTKTGGPFTGGSLLSTTPAPVAPPASAHDPHESVVETVVRIVRNHKWVVLQALIIVPAVVLVLSLQQEKTYSAQASLLFRDSASSLLTDNGGAYVDPDRAAATNQELIDLPEIATGAARSLGGGVSASDVDAAVSVDAAGQSDVVNLNAESADPKLAAKYANAYGDAYIRFRREADRNQLQDAIQLVERSLTTLSPTDQAGDRGRQLSKQLDDLRYQQSLQTGNAEIVQRASVPAEPSSPDVRRNVILGVLLGGVLAFGLASLLERFDRRLRTVEDLESAYGLVVLASIPRSRAFRRQHLSALSTVSKSAEAEAFRTLRSNLRLLTADRQIGSLLIASPMSGDGKSTVARFLAVTMAYMGDRVVLVECDLHKETNDRSDFGGVEGLSTVLQGGELAANIMELPIGGPDGKAGKGWALSVLPAGPVPPNPSQLLESDRMRDVIRSPEESYELVILDTPPLSIVSDAVALVPEVSGVLIVSGLNHTTRNAARDLSKQLALLSARPLGVVANFAPVQEGGFYY